LLFFASGAAALIYQVLWLKELGRLFGVTAHAAAVTLAVFFFGLAAGSISWGGTASRNRNPLRLYALLELGIALSALLYFFLYALYGWLYPILFDVGEGRSGLVLLFKFSLALGVLFPPAFLMGGTLPVMGEFMVSRRDQFGRVASLLYAVNTAGAAVGALSAGFLLPPLLGFRRSYLVAIALNGLVAAVALWLSSGKPPRADPGTARLQLAESSAAGPSAEPLPLLGIAAASGFLTLALEVLCSRMFAQVLQNSIYTFSVILTIFLVALAVGSFIANRLCRLDFSPRAVLFSLLTASGALVGLTPLLFYRSTAGLQPLGVDLAWSRYLPFVIGKTAAVLFFPTIVIGSVFPYLMKMAEQRLRSAGRTLGRLTAANTLAAIAGSLLAGFVLLEVMGLWASIRWMGVAYFLLALATLPSRGPLRTALAAIPVGGCILFGVLVSYGGFASVYLESEGGEELVELIEGSHGTVAVVRRGDDLRLKLDNSYLLGTSNSAPNLRLQSWIPLNLHPHPRSVFYLGMGTGITAGGALALPVESVVVTELHPEVIAAARRHFGPYLNGLFEDPRVAILPEDGRNFLFAAERTFDVIIADIFLTHKAGAGSLYTQEHFEVIRSRLEPDGLFAQWLPMFELSMEEFGIIARTMLEVFPQVTVWTRGFSPRFPLMVLIGQGETAPLDGESFRRNVSALVERSGLPDRTWYFQIPFAAYVGNLSAMRSSFSDYDPTTDDRVELEYLAPVVERDRSAGGAVRELAWEKLAALRADLLRAVPPDEDPYLRGLGSAEIDQVLAGLSRYRYETYRRIGKEELAKVELEKYRRLVDSVTPEAAPRGES
jgi:spermidine synthase